MKEKSKKENINRKERIAKVMARAGLCSRREAERWILDGRVSINGERLKSPAFTVDSNDKIVVDGKVLQEADKTRLFLYHKEGGLVTSARDERGRPTIFDKLPDGLPRLISVGRLDINTEGILLLTNDGELSRYLELPSTGWVRRYRVRAHGVPPKNMIDELKKPITVDGVKYRPVEVAIERQKGANCWMIISLREGKNREIKKLMEHFGLKVNRLIRISYGPFQLGGLDKGAAKEVSAKIIKEQVPGFFKDRN
jgi:23S rRNA pseudouridine2605 synthase